MWNLHQCQCHPQLIKVVSGPQYNNPDATVEFIGRVNEADVFVGNIWVMAHIDTGAQVSTITQDFCEEHMYNKTNAAFRGNRGFAIPYLGYMEATVRIPSIKGYNECIPLLILKSSPYS